MLGLGLGLIHHRYFTAGGRLPAGYVRLRGRLAVGGGITLRGRSRSFGIADLIAQVA